MRARLVFVATVAAAVASCGSGTAWAAASLRARGGQPGGAAFAANATHHVAVGTAASAHFAWAPYTSYNLLPETAVEGGRDHVYGTLHICRVATSEHGVLSGKLLAIPLYGHVCVTDGTTYHQSKDFDILVSANVGTWADVDGSAGPAIAHTVAAGAGKGSAVCPGCSDALVVARVIEDSGDTVPGYAGVSDQSGRPQQACYSDHGKQTCVSTQGSTGGTVSVLTDPGPCPDYSTAPQICNATTRRRTPSPSCSHVEVMARKLGVEELGGEAAQVAGAAPGVLCINHQAFVYHDPGVPTGKWTSGFYGMRLRACVKAACGVGVLCNDPTPHNPYHPITVGDLCADEKASSVVGRSFECEALAAAEAAVADQYDTCAYPTVKPYELTLGAHNCHSYVEDVVAKYDAMMAARGGRS